MSSALPPLNALRVFEVSARLQSFKKASEELFVTPSAISQQIKSLEYSLGVTLFNRTANGISLTPEGHKLLPTLEQVFSDISTVVTDLRKHNKRSLRISAPPALASNWLAKRVSRFEEENPDIVVHLHSSLDRVDFETEGFDCAVRVVPGGKIEEALQKIAEEGLREQFLFNSEIFCVCNPRQLRNIKGEKALPNTPDDLAQFNLLHFRDYTTWAMGALFYDAEEINTHAGIICNSIESLCKCIANGDGVALVDSEILNDHRYRDFLEPILLETNAEHKFGKLDYYFVAPRSSWENEAVNTVRSWLLQQVKTIRGHFAFQEHN